MSDAAPPRPSRRLVAVLAAAVLAIGALGYWRTGDLDALRGDTTTPEQALATMLGDLERRLAQNPNDGAGWALLGRSHDAAGRAADAAAAYAKALPLLGDDPDLLVDYANALGVPARSLAGEPTRLLDRALAAAPGHTRALLLAGTAAFERGDAAAAATHWQRIDPAALGNADLAEKLQTHLAEARRRAGLPAVAAAPASAAAANPAATSIRGTVTLAAALAADTRPDDTVFVYARNAEGPRQPLAIVRARVRDLPLHFTLDDSSAMSPQWRLSQARQVVVDARVSRSGDALPRDGDAVGRSMPIAPGAQDVRIEIAQTLRGNATTTSDAR